MQRFSRRQLLVASLALPMIGASAWIWQGAGARTPVEPRTGGTVPTSQQTPTNAAAAAGGGQKLNQLGRLALIGARDSESRDRAVELLEQAVRAEPANDEYKLDLADAYVVLDLDLTLAAATELYESVLPRRRDDQELLGRLVRAYAALENAPKALEYAERRLQLVPKAGAYDVALQAVSIFAAGGKIDRAIALVQKALAKAPEHHGIRLLLATLRHQTHDDVAVRLMLRQVLDQTAAENPYHEAAEKLLADMEKVQ